MTPHPITLEWIIDCVEHDRYIITRHAEVERRSDDLSIGHVEEALLSGEIIEDYPNDARGPSSLVSGQAGERHVHVVCGRNTDGWLVIITVYIPGPPKWRSPTERNRP